VTGLRAILLFSSGSRTIGEEKGTMIALVTGASLGVGRGIAIGLADAGFRVFATGRSIETADLPSTVTRIRCDHLRDQETGAVFARIAAEAGGLDVLVNSAWGGCERMVENGAFTFGLSFWEQPPHRWAAMMDAGVRAAFVAASYTARIMLPNRRGLMVISALMPRESTSSTLSTACRRPRRIR
jgi:dehydrogenase/reductase SDR family protein 1